MPACSDKVGLAETTKPDPCKEMLGCGVPQPNGEHTPKLKAQFDQLRRRLREESGGIEAIIRSLRCWRNQYPRKTLIARELDYFRRYRHRMQYAGGAAEHLPIGSAVVEAACKTLVTQRLKGSDMCWTHRGGQTILTFRALIRSDRFDRAWARLAATCVKPIHPAAEIMPCHRSPRATSKESAS